MSAVANKIIIDGLIWQTGAACQWHTACFSEARKAVLLLFVAAASLDCGGFTRPPQPFYTPLYLLSFPPPTSNLISSSPTFLIMSKSSAAYQPLPQAAMDFSGLDGKAERRCCGNEHEQGEGGCRASHGACHVERKRRIARILAFSALFSLLALTVAAFASGGLHNLMGCAATALGKRDTNNDTFTDHKRMCHS